MPKPPNSTLNYSTKPMARKPLKARKKPLRRASPPKPKAVELYLDGNGVAFLDAWRFVPKGFPPIKVPKNPAVCEQMHDVFCENRYGVCWLCGKYCVLEAHHIVSRYDVLANIVMLGNDFACGCHKEVQHDPKWLSSVLHTKWAHDRLNTDWVWICLARRKTFDFDIGKL